MAHGKSVRVRLSPNVFMDCWFGLVSVHFDQTCWIGRNEMTERIRLPFVTSRVLVVSDFNCP